MGCYWCVFPPTQITNFIHLRCAVGSASRKKTNTMKRTILFFISLFCISSLWAQDTLTIGEVYNFDIGDKLHYRTSGDPYYYESGIRMTILNKWLSTDEDTLFFEVHYSNFTKTYNGSGITTNYATYDTTTFVSNIKQKITELHTWDDIDFNDTLIHDFVYYYENSIDYGNVITNGYSYEIRGEGEEIILMTEDRWAKGLGMVKNYRSEREEDYYRISDTRLVYFKKGDEEWGSEVMEGIDEGSGKPQTFGFAPNPASSHITLHNTASGQLQIYNISGQLLQTVQLNVIQKTLDISHLPPATYLLQWQQANSQNIWHGKLMKM